MVAEYIAKITGDTSGLEKALKSIKGSMKQLSDDEVLIKLNYDGNVADFNKEFDKVLQQCPDLTIQFQYNVNQKMLTKELDRLQQLKDLKLDVDTNNADKKIASMITALDTAIGSDESSEKIEGRIKGIIKYANTVRELGGIIETDVMDAIYSSVEQTSYEDLFNKLLDSPNTSKLKLFNITKPLTEEINESEKRVEDFQKFLETLETKGASKTGLNSELQNLQDEIKILKSDLSDMKRELDNVSGEQFQKMADDIKEVNEQLQFTLDKLFRLTGENKLGSIVNQWGNEEISKTNERYTAFNSKTLETSGTHAAADAEGVSEKLIREAISEMAGEADGFIHSHPLDIAAFSDTDIATFYKLLNQGITQQIVTSYKQAMSLDMSKVDPAKESEVVQLLQHKFDEAEQEIGTSFIRNNTEMVQRVANQILEGNKTGNDQVDSIIESAKSKYNDLMKQFGSNLTLDQYGEQVVDKALSDAFNESIFANQQGTKVFSQVKSFMGQLSDAIVESLGDMTENKNALQTRFQDILLDVFSNPEYLKAGVQSAIKVENISDFIDTNSLKQVGLLGGKFVVDGFREAIDAHSNSKEAERAVDDFANGVVDEFEKRNQDMADAARRSGSAVVEAFNASLTDSIDELDELLPTGQLSQSSKKDNMYGYHTPIYSEADMDYANENHADVVNGMQHQIDELDEELNDALSENRDLRNQLSESKPLSPVESFYKKYGTPSNALDSGYTVDDVLRMLGGRFAEMDSSQVAQNESRLNLEFFKDLIKYAQLTEDEMTVVKASLQDIDDFAEGGKWRHLVGSDENANIIVKEKLDLINQIIRGEHEISELELSNAQNRLEYNQSNNNESGAARQISSMQKEEEQAEQTAEAERKLAEAREGAESAQSSNTEELMLPAVIKTTEEVYNQVQAWAKRKQQVEEFIATQKEANDVEESASVPNESKEFKDITSEAEKASKAKQGFSEANAEVLRSIVSSLEGLDKEAQAFDNLNKLIKNLANHKDDRILDMVANLELLRDALSKPVEDGAFINAIKDIASQGDNLKDLATVLKTSVKDIQKAKKQVNTKQPSVDEAKFFERTSQALYDVKLFEKQNQYVQEFSDELISLQTRLEELSKLDMIDDKNVAELDQLIKRFKELKKEATLKDNKIANAKSIQKYLGQINEILSSNTNRKFKKSNEYQELLNFKNILNEFDTSKPQSELDELGTHIIETISRVKGLDNAIKGKGFFDKFANRLSDINTKFLAQYFSWHDFIRYGRQMITTIIDLDTQLVDLRKTTKMNNDELELFYQSSSNIAKNLGATTSEIISQAAAWSRLGYNTKEASVQMAELSSQFASISPGLDTDTATDDLVSTMQAFGIKTEEVERQVMDNINAIGNSMATTNAEIGEMLKRSSAAMKAANNTLAETIALEAAAVEITRNAETTGTAFRTISMRIRGYDEETEELSEDLRNISGDIADLTKRAGKTPISIFSDKNKTQYKSTYQILKEISEIWDELTDKQQADLLEKLGGKRGAQSIAGILADFSSVEKAMETMNNAAGSSDKEMGIIRDSIEYKLNALKQTWTSTLQQIADRGKIGGVLDFLTALSEGLGEVVSNLGLVRTAIIAIGTVLSMKYWKNIPLFDMEGNGGILSKIGSALPKLASGFKNLGKTILSSLGKATLSAGLIWVATEGISWITKGIQALWDEVLTNNAENERRAKAVEEVANKISVNKQEIQSIEDATSKYKELNDQLKDTKLSTSQVLDIRQQMMGIQDTLISKYGYEAEAIDLANGEYREQLDLLKQIKEKKTSEYLYGQEGVLKPSNGSTDFQRNLDVVNATVGNYGGIPLGQFGYWDDKTFEDVYGYSLDSIISKYSGLSIDKIVSSDEYGSAYNLVFKIDPNMLKSEATEQLNAFYGELLRQYPNNEYAKKFAEQVANIDIGFDKTQYDEALSNTQYTLEQILTHEANGGQNVIAKLQESVSEYNKALDQYEKDPSEETRKTLKEAKENLEIAKSDAYDIKSIISSYGSGADDQYDKLLNSVLINKKDDIDERIIKKVNKILGGSHELFDEVRGKLASLTEEEQIELELIISDHDEVILFKDLDNIIEEAQERAKNKPIELQTQVKSSDVVESMANVKSAVGSLSDLYNQIVETRLKMGKDKKYLNSSGEVEKEGDTDGLAPGFADPSLLQSVKSAFDSYITTLSDDESKQAIAHALEEFDETLLKFPNDVDKAQAAIDTLINSYIDQSAIIERLDESNKEWSIAQMEAMGITNATAVAETRLNQHNKELLKSERKLADAFRKHHDALEDVNKGSKEYEDAINGVGDSEEGLLEIVQEMFSYLSDDITKNIDFSFIEENLDSIRQYAAGDVDQLDQLQIALAKRYIATVQIKADTVQEVEGIKNNLNYLIENLDLKDIEVGTYLDNDEMVKGVKEFYDLLQGMVNAGMIAADDLNKIMSSIGFEPEVVDTKRVEVSSHIQATIAKNGYMSAADIQHAYNSAVEGYIELPVVQFKRTNGVAKTNYKAPKSPPSSTGSNGGNGGSGNKLSKDQEESFDWIEVKIQRLDEEISRLDKTVGNVYENWSDRNEALGDELEKVREEMEVHEHAYNRYLENAKAVEIKDPKSEDEYSDKDEKQKAYDQQQYDEAVKAWATGEYQRKVREGLIGENDIEKIQNKWLADAIKEYQELYNKAVQAGDAIQDDKIKLGDLNKTKFDNIKSEFDGIIGLWESEGDAIDKLIERTEEHGYFVSEKYYDQKKALVQDRIDAEIKKLRDLTKVRDEAVATGAIKEGSEEWVNMTKDIKDLENEINGYYTELVKLDNEQRQLRWDGFDYAIEKLDKMNDEAEFLIDLLDNKDLFNFEYDERGHKTYDGTMSDRGWAAAGLHASQYNKELLKSKYAAEQLAEVEEQLATEKGKNDKNLIARREEMLELQRSSIQAAEQEKEAIKDLVEEGINKHLDSLSELIEKYKESLSEARDLYNYQKDIASQTKQISSLQKQLSAYSGDDSEEARAKRQQLSESLKEAETNLKETEWDRYISETNDMLDQMFDEYSDVLNQRLDDVDALMVYMTDQINARSGEIQTTIEDVATDYAYKTTPEFQRMFEGNGELISTFSGNFDDFSSNVIDALDTLVQNTLELTKGDNVMKQVESEGLTGQAHKSKKGYWYENADGSYAKNEYRNGYWYDKNGYWNGTEKKATWKQNDKGWWYQYGNGKYPKNQWLKIDGEWYYFDENGYMVTGERMINGEKHFFTNSGKWTKNYGKKAYATGSSHIPYDQLAWTQEQGSELIFRASDGAMLTPLNKGDMVFTNDMTKNLWDLAKNPALTGATVKLPESALTARTVNNENAITVVLPNVQSYDDFKQALMKDKQITNFMQSVTIGQALGKGKLNRGNM